MSLLKDAGSPYSRHSDTTLLTALIGEALGSPKAGTQVMAALIVPGEQATAQNIRTRLRVAIQSGQIRDLTPKRLQRLQAALELGRLLYVDELEQGEAIDSPELAARAFQSIAWEPVEKFAVLSLDIKHRALSLSIVSAGTATETLANPRDIFSAVIRASGVRCIVAHNHPSGFIDPSIEDLSLTRTLLNASQVMNIPILDHLIVSQGRFVSLRAKTDLWEGYV
ncbi:MAG: JAB domain-containing protein [Cyanobacteria bacterium P01_A01_bin.135]